MMVEDALQLVLANDTVVSIAIRMNPRANRYILRAKRDGSFYLTLPKGGNRNAGIGFVKQQVDWIAKQFTRLNSTDKANLDWKDGEQLLFMGRILTITIERRNPSLMHAVFGEHRVIIEENVQTTIRNYLFGLAKEKLTERLKLLAARVGLKVNRVNIRNQKTRWGSCSPTGNISLNWRLIQVPEPVMDYVIYHELMHLLEMNHSPAFWALVRKVCPDYQYARHWLRRNSQLLLD